MNKNIPNSLTEFRHHLDYYGVDFTVEMLVDKLKNNEVFIPEFQRNYVWTLEQASRFIESLLLNFPIPTVFLATTKTNKNQYLIVDGLQRLYTLYYFYRGFFPNRENGDTPDIKFLLKDVVEEFNGKSYQDLEYIDQRQLDRYLVHCIILHESANSNKMYHLFERLNTGGTGLSPQEIRNALYYGNFVELLHHLADWVETQEIEFLDNTRRKAEEAILFFFAFKYGGKKYLNYSEWSDYLNDYLNDYKDEGLNTKQGREMVETFKATIDFIQKMFDKEILINASLGIFSSAYNLLMQIFSKKENRVLTKSQASVFLQQATIKKYADPRPMQEWNYEFIEGLQQILDETLKS